MTYTDSRKGEVIAGYKCIGHTKDRLWGQFKFDNSQEWSAQQRLEWQRENQRRRNEKAEEDGKRRRRSLSAAERHEQYTRLLSDLTLHPDDRADLVRRGFTHQQIELSGVKSVECYQQLQNQFSTLLPGISPNGRNLIIKHGGYLCPVRDADGFIVACQVRLRALPDGESNRYRWLSSKAQTLHLFPEGCKPEGELPLAVFRTQGKPEGIALAEGTGAKPFLVSQRLGLLTIGAAGGQWASSPELFRSTLEKVALEVAGKVINIFPDAGDVLNQSVMSRWQRVIALLEEWGWSVEVGWWGQADKSCNDIDELTDYSQVEYISPTEFLVKAKVKPTEQKKGFATASGCQLQPSTLKDSESKSVNQKRYVKPIKELPKVGFHIIRRKQSELLERFDALQTKRGQEWLQLRKFTPDVVIDSRYFDYDFKPGESLAIKSGLGTGKSYFTNAKWLANPDEGAVSGGYRNCLNEQFCAKGKELNGRTWYQIQSDLKNTESMALIADPESRISSAIDSWIYFAPHHFDGKKAIFDEVESVAKHLNQSDTAVSFHRDVIKQRVSDALSSSIANLVADGNLRDFTIEYLEKLSGGRKFTKILNKYTGNRGKIYLYNGSCRKRKATEEDVKLELASSIGEWISFDYKADDYSKLHRVMMELPTDIPLLILSDSQKKCEAWDRELATTGRKVFRLDSTSSGTDLGKLFLQNPREFILSERIDAVILSPSAESGVSIELADELNRQIPGYFKYEFSFFFGISTTDIQSQFLGRNRDPYTIKLSYVQSHSIANTRQITESQDSNDVFNNWIETMKECASLSLQGIEEGEILKLALEKIKEQLLNPHIQYEAKLMLKESFERTHPRLCLEYSLREAGWEVVVLESKEDDISDLKATQEEISLEKAAAIFKSEEITSSEADQLARKLNKTPEERHQITKSRLLGRLPGLEEKVVIEEKKISSPEQLQRIEESESEKVISVGNTPYEEWKASSQPIPEKGLEVVVQKPAFSPEFINKVMDKDRHFISRLESQFFLKNPDICKLVQQHKWHKKLDLLTDPDKVNFGGLPVARYRSRWLEVNTLIQMGVTFFLDPSNSWSDETPEAVAFWEKGKIPRIARNIGVSHEDDPCRYIGKVLQKYSLRTQEKRKQKPDGTRYREYSIKSLDSLSQAVYECVEQRINSQVNDFIFDWKKIIKNSTFSEPESLATTELQSVHMAPDNLIKIRGDVDVNLEVKASGVLQNTSVCDESQEVTREPSITKNLCEAFQSCESFTDFVAVVEGFAATPEQVEDALLYQPARRRQLLRQWWEQGADDTASDVPLPEKMTVEVLKSTELLRQAIAHGLDTLHAVFSRWTSSQRWEAVSQLEETSAGDMVRLIEVAPNWVDLCDAT
jgi:hypothetical protein